MSVRSTRNKIRLQGQMAIKVLDQVFQHLQYLDELAGGRSDYINQNLPLIVSLGDDYKQVLLRFREGL